MAPKISLCMEIKVIMRVMNFVAGFLSGVIMGAVIVLLTTPQSGSDLQTEVRTRFDEMLAEARRVKAERQAELKAQLASLKAG